MSTSLAELQSTNFKTTRHGDELNGRLMPKLGFRTRYEPARLAIARSLAVPEPPGSVGGDEEEESGKVIKGENLFGTGGELATWISLLVEHGQLTDATKRDIQEAVRRHWHRGIELLWTEWTECEEDFDKFLMRLAERAGVRGEATLAGAQRPPATGRSQWRRWRPAAPSPLDRHLVPISMNTQCIAPRRP